MRYLNYQTIIQYRIPIDDKGIAGQPEVIKKFTTQYGEFKPVKKKTKTLFAEESDEVVTL